MLVTTTVSSHTSKIINCILNQNLWEQLFCSSPSEEAQSRAAIIVDITFATKEACSKTGAERIRVNMRVNFIMSCVGINSILSVPPLPRPGDPPRVIVLLVLVVQRLDPLVLLEVGQLRRVRHLEERRRELHQPLGVDGRHLRENWFLALTAFGVWTYISPQPQCKCHSW